MVAGRGGRASWLTTDGFRDYTPIPYMLQVRDGACWTQSTPTNMGRSGPEPGGSTNRLEMELSRRARIRVVGGLEMGAVVHTCTATSRPRLSYGEIVVPHVRRYVWVIGS